MHQEPNLTEIQKEWHGSMHAYLIGVSASLLLTIGAYLLVIFRPQIPKLILISAIVGLGIMQAAVQLIFFLHIGQEAKPRWETLIFSFMILVLLIVVLGSLWIMHDLNHRVMTM